MRHCCVRKLVWLLEELQWLRSQLEHNREQHQMQITYLCRQSQNLAVATQQHVHLWVGLLLHWSLSAVCVHLCVCVCVWSSRSPLTRLFFFFPFFFFPLKHLKLPLYLFEYEEWPHDFVTVYPDFIQCMLILSTYLSEPSSLRRALQRSRLPRLAVFYCSCMFFPRIFFSLSTCLLFLSRTLSYSLFLHVYLFLTDSACASEWNFIIWGIKRDRLRRRWKISNDRVVWRVPTWSRRPSTPQSWWLFFNNSSCSVPLIPQRISNPIHFIY